MPRELLDYYTILIIRIATVAQLYQKDHGPERRSETTEMVRACDELGEARNTEISVEIGMYQGKGRDDNRKQDGKIKPREKKKKSIMIAINCTNKVYSCCLQGGATVLIQHSITSKV